MVVLQTGQTMVTMVIIPLYAVTFRLLKGDARVGYNNTSILDEKYFRFCSSQEVLHAGNARFTGNEIAEIYIVPNNSDIIYVYITMCAVG